MESEDGFESRTVHNTGYVLNDGVQECNELRGGFQENGMVYTLGDQLSDWVVVEYILAGSTPVYSTIKLKLMKRFELKNFIEKQFKQYGLFGLYKGSIGIQDDCTDLLYHIEDNILDKVEELYVQH